MIQNYRTILNSRSSLLQSNETLYPLNSFNTRKLFSTNDKGEGSTTANEESKEGEAATTDPSKKTIDDLQKEIKQLKDAVLRSYAEEENVR